MLKRSNMLMIGASNRHVGKTEFACRVIRRWSGAVPVVGAKVTTIRERSGGCPRGGDGCGACCSLSGDYEISEETGRAGAKDTARMLAAGASQVLWLRVKHEHLREGVEALLNRIPVPAAVVCESNSLRTVLDPGLFLVLRGAAPPKPSCAGVAEFADRMVRFDGTGWDLSPDEIVFAQGRWLVRENAAAIILAGGRSRRMGRDKSLMPFAGQPLIRHIADQLRPAFAELIIGANNPDKYKSLDAVIVPDRQPDCGPLMGILSCLASSGHDVNFVTGCDIPTMDLGFIRQLFRAVDGYDIVMPLAPDGRPEPLFALYRKSVIPAAEAILGRGGRRIVELIASCNVKHVPMPDTGWYQNLNTPEDYQRAAGDIRESQMKTSNNLS